MKKILKRILRKSYWTFGYLGFGLLPINKKKVFFESFLGVSYSDNPKAIYEYMKSQTEFDDYSLYWSFKDPKKFKNEKLKKFKRIRFKYLYHLYTSKYIINNSRMPLYFKKRKNQIYVQTWHGTPLKKLVYDMDNVLMPGNNSERYKRNFSKDVHDWNYLISPNNFSTQTFRRAFRYDGPILETGYPRTDELFKYEKKDIDVIKEKLNIPKNKIVVLYAPTFRDDEYVRAGHYIQKLSIDFDSIKRDKLDIVFLLRTHYLVKDIHGRYSNENNQNYIDVSTYDDINDLFYISNILITDYSSVFFEYALLKKPIIFYQYDYEKYAGQLRGFYLENSELPGKIVYNEQELHQILKKYSAKIGNYDKLEKNKLYSEKFIFDFLSTERGNSSEKVTNKIFKG